LRERDQDAKSRLNILSQDGRRRISGLLDPKQYGGWSRLSHALYCQRRVEYIDSSARVIISVSQRPALLRAAAVGTEAHSRNISHARARRKAVDIRSHEPAAGSDVAGIPGLRREKRRSLRSNGEKIWISLSTVADQYLVMAYRIVKNKRHAIIRHQRFIVERAWKGVPYALHGKLGVRSRRHRPAWHFRTSKFPPRTCSAHRRRFPHRHVALDNGVPPSRRSHRLDRAVSMQHQILPRAQTFKREIGSISSFSNDCKHGPEPRCRAICSCENAAGLKISANAGTREVALAKWTNTVNAHSPPTHAIETTAPMATATNSRRAFLAQQPRRVIYEGTKEVQQIIQAEYALGYRHDGALRCELPGWTES